MKEVEGFTNYSVTKDGRVFSKTKELKQYVKCNKARGKTYSMVYLYNSGGRKCFLVHRLVAIAFIDNPMNKKAVNHIDGNKNNNHVDNLEWCTNSENIQHAFDTKLRVAKKGIENHSSKSVSCYDMKNNHVRTFFSAREAVKQGYATEFKNVSAVCRYKRKSHNGYIWRFTDE